VVKKKKLLKLRVISVAQNTEPVKNICEHCHEPSNYMKGGEGLESLSDCFNLKPDSAFWSYGNTKSALPFYANTTMITAILYNDIDFTVPLKKFCSHYFTQKLP
jgi:hypothetical protein